MAELFAALPTFLPALVAELRAIRTRIAEKVNLLAIVCDEKDVLCARVWELEGIVEELVHRTGNQRAAIDAGIRKWTQERATVRKLEAERSAIESLLARYKQGNICEVQVVESLMEIL